MSIPFASGSVDEARYRESLGHFASGVTIVTALEQGSPAGVTCQSFSALSLDPPLVVLAAGRRSTSWPRIIKAGTFCVNVLTSSQGALARSFASSSADKFDGVDWEPSALGAPILEGSLAFVECTLDSVIESGDHNLVVGRVLDLGTREGRPLLFYRGEFAELGT